MIEAKQIRYAGRLHCNNRLSKAISVRLEANTQKFNKLKENIEFIAGFKDYFQFDFE